MTDERMKGVIECYQAAVNRKVESLGLFLDAFWYCFDEYGRRFWLGYSNGRVTLTDDDDNILMDFTR